MIGLLGIKVFILFGIKGDILAITKTEFFMTKSKKPIQ